MNTKKIFKKVVEWKFKEGSLRCISAFFLISFGVFFGVLTSSWIYFFTLVGVYIFLFFLFHLKREVYYLELKEKVK